jgi:hypothetical protein
VLWQKPAFYGHPTLSTWFTGEYKKSGKKLDMGKGCVRFKSLEDLALDVRFAGREPHGGRPRAVASWSREAGDTVLVKTVGRTVARVSVGEHMANYRAARALLGKGKKAKPKK